MNRRAEIKMSEEEIATFLDEERVAIVSTFGPRGWPHSMPLWYLVRDGSILAWTFRKAQKVRNLERDPRATVLVEAGYDSYGDLRGVMFECETVIHDDLDAVVEFAMGMTSRYVPGGGEPAPEAVEAYRAQAPKRVVLEFRPIHTISWDHRKLGGAL
jgi:PPOX class probable F420-dependent enzyme